jgi:hypothetical protein
MKTTMTPWRAENEPFDGGYLVIFSHSWEDCCQGDTEGCASPNPSVGEGVVMEGILI